jgi:Uma2 family endonuclease
MFVGKKIGSKSAFYHFIALDENADRVFELIAGEIVEKMPSFGYTSSIGARLTTFVGMYLLNNPIAHMTDAQGGYDLDDETTLVPDIAVILKSRQPTLPTDSYIPQAPDFAIEVVSQSDLKNPTERIDRKIEQYRKAGVPLFWYVYYNRREVDVHRKGQPKQTFGIEDTLDAGDVLPGFQVKVRDIFGE